MEWWHGQTWNQVLPLGGDMETHGTIWVHMQDAVVWAVHWNNSNGEQKKGFNKVFDIKHIQTCVCHMYPGDNT